MTIAAPSKVCSTPFLCRSQDPAPEVAPQLDAELPTGARMLALITALEEGSKYQRMSRHQCGSSDDELVACSKFQSRRIRKCYDSLCSNVSLVQIHMLNPETHKSAPLSTPTGAAIECPRRASRNKAAAWKVEECMLLEGSDVGSGLMFVEGRVAEIALDKIEDRRAAVECLVR
jgi:hypothetical protein